MRVALLSMPELSPWIRGESWHIPNLAITNIAANTPEIHEVKTFDLNRRRRGVKKAVQKILDDFKPDILGMSSMTFQYETARSIAWMAKKQNPRVVTVLGGYHASMMYRELAESWDRNLFDWLVRGEGDFAIAEIIEVLQGRRRPEDVSGASFKADERFTHNDDRPLQDLRDLNLPARHKRGYLGAHQAFALADVFETSRGCTLACNYCSINTMYGKSHRFFSIDYVLRDLQQISRGLVTEVFCSDDNMTNDLDRLEELCDAMIINRKRLRVDIHITTQATCAGIAQSQRLVDKMGKAGFTKVFLGIENGSAKTLREIKKGDIVELTRTAVRRLHEANICVVGGCITGFPHDDIREIRENYEFFKSLGVEHVIPQIITPYPGTPSRELALEAGYVTNKDDLRWYNGYWANVRTDFLDSASLEFYRWKLAKEVIGPFYATPTWLKHYPISGRLWNHVFRPSYLVADKVLNKVMGEKRRYEWAMNAFRTMDTFDLEAPPVPFRVTTQAPRERNYAMRGIQGWTGADQSRKRHNLPILQAG
jgi:anaerobic magnesium-protoporphyrin IX monomethyl ester cyclase